MKKGFWRKIKAPIFVLAPMANVTDLAFRELIAKYGKPDVMWTEFVSVEGLLSKGREALLVDLQYSKKQRPIVAQIFGSKPDQFFQVAQLLKELKFDGIDINMGCPDKNVEKTGGGAALIKNPKLAQEIIEATKRGAGDLPVSVKTRIGYSKNEIETWAKHLLEAELSAITVHFRTRKEMSKVPAHWELIKPMMNFVEKEIPNKEDRPAILANGDIIDMKCGRALIKDTGIDGVMIGRGIFGNPFLFNKKKSIEDLPVKQRLKILVEHMRLFEKHFKGIKRFEVMKKHFKAYVTGFDGAKELRMELMDTKTRGEAEKIIKNF